MVSSLPVGGGVCCGVGLASGVGGGGTFRGNFCRVEMRANQLPLAFEFPSSAALLKAGEQITFSLEPDWALQVLLE